VKLEAITVGREGETVVVIDGFAEDYLALREAAAAAQFGPARHLYPGLRAPLPPGYLDLQGPLIRQAVAAHLQPCARIETIDASFSLVTTPPADLHPRQRVPHADAFARERIALVHFLSDDPAGTAFYRHRLSGFETINDTRAPSFFAALEAQLSMPPDGYIAGDSELFEQLLVVPAKRNRAIVYRSWLLHSGAIPEDANLSPDPLSGRLTVTGFFTVE
jgi:hypothetical protein